MGRICRKSAKIMDKIWENGDIKANTIAQQTWAPLFPQNALGFCGGPDRQEFPSSDL